MNTPAIEVVHVSKSYRIGASPKKQMLLREGATNLARNLARVARRLTGKPVTPAKNTFWALKDVSFTVQNGEALGIIGRNGAGKSTMLKILTRITYPTEGYARIRGRVGSLLEVGTGFHPELTGRENTYMSGAILGMRRAEIDRKFDEIVAFSGIERFIDTPVKRYSSGMYLRLAFAVSAHLTADILLVDEVLAVGDAEFQNKCLGKMDTVASEGRTVLFISHNMQAVKNLCDNAIWLNNGQLHQYGPVDDVVGSYLSYVKTEAADSAVFPAINRQAGLSIERCDVELTPHPGDVGTVDLALTLVVDAKQAWTRMGVGLKFTTELGVEVAVINAEMTNFRVDLEPGRNHIVITCPRINRLLAMGDYIFGVTLVTPPAQPFIEVDNAAIIPVPGLDLYHTGYYAEARRHGPVVLPVTITNQGHG